MCRGRTEVRLRSEAFARFVSGPVSDGAKLYLTSPSASGRFVHSRQNMNDKRIRVRLLGAGALCAVLSAVACARGESPADAGTATPVYNERTGRLEELRSDTNHDGKVDTLAHMDGVRLKYIEIDRDFDGRFDRWEYYVEAPGTRAAAAAPDGRSVLDHAEDASGQDDRITRREFYVDGTISRVEEDVDLDGRIDKCEAYAGGVLQRMDLDLDGVGRPTRRLIYKANGQVERVEADPDGDGRFEVVSPAGKGGGG